MDFIIFILVLGNSELLKMLSSWDQSEAKCKTGILLLPHPQEEQPEEPIDDLYVH